MAPSICRRTWRRSGRKSRKDVKWSTVQQRRYAIKAISTRLGTDPESRVPVFNFDIDLQWTPEPRPQGLPEAQRPSFLPSVDPNGSPLFTALQEQLGLKLESTKGATDLLVVDHVEHPTAD